MKILCVVCLFALIWSLFPGVIADIAVPAIVASGTDFSVSGMTNFNTDNKVLIEVFPASFGPAGKFDSSMTGGSSQVVPVRKDDSGRFFWNGTFSTDRWGEDTYMVRVEVIGKDYRETRVFSLISSESASGQEPVPTQKETPKVVQTQETAQQTTNETAIVNSAIPEETHSQSPMSPGTLISALFIGTGIFLLVHRR